jgi:tRNA A37 threonylcarbamoyladenosine synthetase subunit TsaC/SUA5/YrdC
MPLVAIPTTADVYRITKAFLTDLESFTFQDELSKEFKPIICSICDSMPTKAQWSTFVDIDEFTKLCTKGKLQKTDSPEKYPMEL